MTSQKYAKANNQYLNDYNHEQPHSYIMYLDANNLYCWAISQCLPTVDFLDVMMVDKDADKGYML